MKYERAWYKINAPCMQDKILPRSLVRVVKTRTCLPAIVNIPTVFSGFDYNYPKKSKPDLSNKTQKGEKESEITWVLAPHKRLTASA